MNITPDCLSELPPNGTFVFGSNLAGYHGKGAALWALRRFGAVYGRGEGLQGQSYALPTKDGHLKPLPIKSVFEHVTRFLAFAASRPDLHFYVTPVGCGLAGYSPDEMAPLFLSNPSASLPANVWLPRTFWRAAGQLP